MKSGLRVIEAFIGKNWYVAFRCFEKSHLKFSTFIWTLLSIATYYKLLYLLLKNDWKLKQIGFKT